MSTVGDRVGVLQVGPRQLAKSLLLPEGSQVIGAHWDAIARRIDLLVESPEFNEIAEGVHPPRVDLKMSVHDADQGERVTNGNYKDDLLR